MRVFLQLPWWATGHLDDCVEKPGQEEHRRGGSLLPVDHHLLTTNLEMINISTLIIMILAALMIIQRFLSVSDHLDDLDHSSLLLR